MNTGLGFIDLIDQKTTEKIEREAKEGKKKNPLRPSSAGSCTRVLTFQMMEYLKRAEYKRKLFEPSVHRLLKLGSSVEWHVIDQFKLINEDYEIRYKQQALDFGVITSSVDPSLSCRIEGAIDFVIWGEDTKCVADVKSVKDWSRGWKTHWSDVAEKLERMPSVESISDKVFWVEDLVAFLAELKDPFFESNFCQVNFYANNEFLKNRDINQGAIIKYNKNTSQWREIRFKPSEEIYQKTLSKFQSVLDAVAKGGPEHAKRDYDPKTHMVCRYCKFSAQCRKIPTQLSEGETNKEVPNGI